MSQSAAIATPMHLIARHAASAVWLARYIERIDNLARLLDVTKTFSYDDSDLVDHPAHQRRCDRFPAALPCGDA